MRYARRGGCTQCPRLSNATPEAIPRRVSVPRLEGGGVMPPPSAGGRNEHVGTAHINLPYGSSLLEPYPQE
jgi:hypothetical protein